MDFEWHLIRFCHGAVVHKQVAQPPELKDQAKLEDTCAANIVNCSLPNFSVKLYKKLLNIRGDLMKTNCFYKGSRNHVKPATL